MTNQKIIIALDFDSYDRAVLMARELDPALCNLKVGSQLFTSSGPKVVNELRKLGFNIFLDLKFHDIPNTVLGSVQSALSMGVWMLNVHVSGGSEMMKSARSAVSDSEDKPIILGVTVLTSIGNELAKELDIDNIQEKVLSLAKLAKKSSLDGVVCSPREILPIKKELGDSFIVVTPGIRIESYNNDDQIRTATPKEAFENGADYIVVGRPITESTDPNKSLEVLLSTI